MAAMIFDTHAHYDDERFDGKLDEFWLTPENDNVCGAIHCGINLQSSKNALLLADKYPCLYAAVGIHPQEVNAETTFKKEDFLPLIAHKKVVAIGEIGLDYYWDTTYKAKQKEILLKQIAFANEQGMPISFHDREAHADSLEILKETKPRGVVHCFSGSPEMASELLKTGMYIGVGGVVTFKNSKKLVEVVESVPLERILLETDAPYLAPEPFRGKLNHSALIKYVAEKIAEIKKISVENVLEQNLINVKTLFGV